jgi:hypothetical protein
VSFEEEFGEGSGEESSKFTKLREQLNAELAEKKKVLRERDELREFKAQVEKERTTNQVATIFADLGLPAKAANLAVKDRPDQEWDSDAAREWATEYGWTPVEAAPEPEPEPVVQVPASSFVPTPQVGSTQTRMSYAEFRQGLKSQDPATRRSLISAFEKGLVDKE